MDGFKEKEFLTTKTAF